MGTHRTALSLWALVVAGVGVLPAQQIDLTLTQDASGDLAIAPAVAATITLDNSQPSRTIAITCGAGLDCSALAAVFQKGGQQVGMDLRRAQGGPPFRFTVTRNAMGSETSLGLFLRVGTKTVQVATVTRSGQEVVDDQTPPTLEELLAKRCPEYPAVVTRSAKDNLVTFVATPLGNVLRRPPYADENDSVVVVVPAAKGLLAGLIVRRKSAFLQPGTISIAGAEVVGDLAGLVRDQAAGEEHPALGCGTERYVLADFAGGRGEVEIAVRTDKGEISLGTFDFAVHRLYQGAFAFGWTVSTLRDPTFGVAFDGTDSVVTETEDGVALKRSKVRMMYALFYVPFLRHVDIELGHPIFAPAIGLALNDVSQNGFLGLAFGDFRSVFLVVGGHLGHVRRLDPNAGLSVGDPILTSTIATERHWDAGFFVSATLDVRVAAALLRGALGGAR